LFMSQGVSVGATAADHHMTARGIGAGPQLGCGALGGVVVMDANIGEVLTESSFHVGAGRLVKGSTAGTQDVMNSGTLHLRLLTLAETVLMPTLHPLRPGLPNPPEHLHHGRVTNAPLLSHQPWKGHATLCDRFAGGCALVGTAGRFAVVLVAHRLSSCHVSF
jgi:hypothetical protein